MYTNDDLLREIRRLEREIERLKVVEVPASLLWDDIRTAGESTRPGATAPAVAAFGPSGSWKEGSNIYPHVHWTPVSATAGNVVWQFDYSWANINGTFGAPTTIAFLPTAAGGTAWVHKLTRPAVAPYYISGAGMTISSMLICRLHRDAGAGSDTLAANVAFLEFDLHYQSDSTGSRSELTK
jgi:hypothetical protein